jgi:hypothetical protein
MKEENNKEVTITNAMNSPKENIATGGMFK